MMDAAEGVDGGKEKKSFGFRGWFQRPSGQRVSVDISDYSLVIDH